MVVEFCQLQVGDCLQMSADFDYFLGVEAADVDDLQVASERIPKGVVAFAGGDDLELLVEVRDDVLPDGLRLV